jgi:hypothetical protein
MSRHAGWRRTTAWVALVAPALLVASGPAQAHYVWLEREGNAARAYFGEFGEDLREKSGGVLDRIAAPRAFADPAVSLPIERRADHLEIAAAPAGDLRLVEAGMAPRDDRRAGGKTKTVFYAREGRSENRAHLDLELVPVTPHGNVFTLLLRGAPVAKTEVKVFGPPRWEKAFRTDDQGRVTIATPWRGRYVVEVVHLEERPGGVGADAHDRLRHVATLSFVADQGIEWDEK